MYQKELNTMSGMWAVWDYEAYKFVDDYDKWEPLFCEDEDIIKQIDKNTFVPIYVHEDGIRAFDVKIDEDLNEREKKYIITKSEPYLLNSTGRVHISGIECIASNVRTDEAITVELEKGCYSVQIYLIAWDDEPEAFLSNGEVSPNALPDFIVVIKSNPDMDYNYRKELETFVE